MKKIGRKVKRVISLVLAIVLIVMMIPQSAVSAYGEELNEEITAELNVDSDGETLVDLVEEPDVETEVEKDESELESGEESFEEDIDELPGDESEELLAEDISEEEISLQGEPSVVHFDMLSEGYIKTDDRASSCFISEGDPDGWADSLEFAYKETEQGKYTIGIDVNELQVKNDDLSAKGYVFKGWVQCDNSGASLDIPYPEDGLFNSNEIFVIYKPVWEIDYSNDVFFTFDPDGGEFDREYLKYELIDKNIYFGEPEVSLTEEDFPTFDLKTPIKFRYEYHPVYDPNFVGLRLQGVTNLLAHKDGAELFDWYLKKADGSPDMSCNYFNYLRAHSDQEITEDVTFMAVYSSDKNTITFDANGGTMKRDSKAVTVEGDNGDGYCERQSFYYSYDATTENWSIDWSEPIDEINPPYEDCSFKGWVDDASLGDVYIDEDYSFQVNIPRTYHAKWCQDITDLVPHLDTSFGAGDNDGFDGIKFFQKGRKVYYSFKIKQEDYKDIYVGEGEELVLYVEHGAGRPIVNCNIGDPHRSRGATCTVDRSKEEFIVEYPLFDYLQEDYRDYFELGFRYVVVKKNGNNPINYTDIWDNNIVNLGHDIVWLEHPVNIGATATLPTPTLDTTFGQNGIDYIWDKDADGKDRMSVSFRVPKSDYSGINLLDDEILKLAFYYGTRKPNLKNSGSPETSGTYRGYYIGGNAETVKQGSTLRETPVTGGMTGEIHDFDGDYFTVTLPIFCPYDWKYSDNIYVGLRYVIQESDSVNNPNEYIDEDKAIYGQKSEGLYKKNSVLVKIKYPADQAAAQIKDGSTIIEPAGTESISEQLTEASYILDGTKNYTFATEAVNGYKISKVSYRNGSSANPASWTSSLAFSYTKTGFKPSADNAVISVESTPVYSPILSKGDAELSPDNGVYSVSYLDEIKFEIKKGAGTITPDKIVAKVGTKTVENYSGVNKFSFASINAAYGKKVTVELYEAGNGKAVATISMQVSTPITSVAFKNKNVFKPAIDGGAVTSVVTVNKGADINGLGIMYIYEGNSHESAPEDIDISLDNGLLTITPTENCEVGRTVDIYFYDKERSPKAFYGWSDPEIKAGQFRVTTQAPAWANKTPNASLVSANDYQLDIKVTAPSGTAFDSRYYAMVKLSANNSTAKGLKAGLAVNTTAQCVEINPDGTIPTILLNAFTSGGSEVTTLGDGCGTSITADVYIVKTVGNEYPTESNILASTNHKKLTVSTKKPYYADKITLRKTAKATKLYANEKDVLVATVDLGKNATYTRKQDWKIVNKEELDYQGIDVRQYDATQIETDINSAHAGTYTIKVETVPPEGGVPATASVNITVLPTAIYIPMDEIKISHKLGTAVSYKVSPVVYDQDDNVLKNASLSYTVGKYNGSDYEPTTDLSVTKGTIKSDKSFEAGHNKYAISIAATLGQTIETAWIPITFKEYEGACVKINTLKLGIEDPANPGKIIEIAKNANVPFGTTIYYKAYNSATPGAADNTEWSELNPNQYKNAGKDLSVTSDTLTLSGPNFYSIAENKAPKTVTLKATSIDGSKASTSFKLTYAKDGDKYNTLFFYNELALDKSCNFGTKSTYEIDITDRNLLEGDSIEVALANDSNNWDWAYEKSLVDAKIEVKGANVIYDFYGKKQYLKIKLTKKEATITLKKGNAVVGTVKVINGVMDFPKPPTVKSITYDGDKKLYRGYKYPVGESGTEIVFDLSAPLKDSEGNIIEQNDVYVCTGGSNVFEDGDLESAKYIYNSDTKKAQVVAKLEPYYYNETGYCYCRDEKRMGFVFDYRYKDQWGKPLCRNSTEVNVTPSDFKKSFALKTSQKMTRTVYKDGTYTDSVLVPNYTATGVESVTFTELLNYNAKGTYTTFNTDYHLYEDQISLASSDSYPVDKKGKPLSSEGYIKCHVKFQNGDEQDYITKVKIDWNLVKSNQASAINGRL